jgi:hypothetical protein
MRINDILIEGLRNPKDNPCWKGYHPVGTKKKNGRTVPNCVPNEGVEEQVAPHDRGEYDREGEMAQQDLETAADAANELRSILDSDENLPEWVQSKITKAVDYLDTVRDYMKSKDTSEAVSPAQQAAIAIAKKKQGESLEETYEGDAFYEAYGEVEETLEEAEYQGRKVQLGKPMRGDVKKFKVYVKDPKTGNVKKVNFGDPNMKIRKSNPKARKSFRARHNCANPGPRTKARYWSCRKW